MADLLDPARLTAARIEQAARLLRRRGQTAAAAMTPLAPVLQRLRLTGGQPAARAARKSGTAAGATGAPAPGGIKTLEQADSHQVVGLLLDHPALALRLGLRVDVEIDPLPGVHTIRMVSPSGMPLDGPVAAPQPWSRVECDPDSRRFIMAANPSGQSEIVNGMLDLRPPTPSKPGGAVVSDLDVVGVTAQLHVLASSLAGQSVAGQPIALPSRRDVGLTVAQVDRRSGTVEGALKSASLFQVQQPGRETVEGAPVLYAEDVTGGYRVDLQMDDGPFLSLMRRHISYHIGAGGTASRIPLEVHDEGQVDPIVAVEQYDADGNPRVLVGEELFGFDGWSLSVPRPGLKVVAEGEGTPNVAPVEPAPAPGYPLTMVTRVEPGTLPRLRYGRRYAFRARAVDLAGSSIDPDLCDNSLASAPVVYRRYEPVPPPTLVPRKAFEPGESLVRLVVCTDGDGNVLRATCERHVAAPKASQHLAELHGCFDEAFGPDTPARAAARARLLEIARREAGSFLDVQVPHPTGPGMIQAKGIAITTNDPVNRPPVSKLPLPRGQALQDGEYVIHDTPGVALPHLPDPAAAGAAITGLPGVPGVVKVTYSGGTWPDARPFRLVLRPGTTGPAVANVVQAGGIQALNIALAPGTVVETQLTSTLTPAGLDVMSPLPAAQRQAALDGQVPILSPRQPLTLVHAVRSPIEKPRLTFFSTLQTENGLEVTRDAGTTSVSLNGLIECHAAATAQVDVEATWEEIVDRPGRPVVTESRREVAASYLVAPGQSAIPFGTMPNPLPPGFPATAPAPAALHRFGDNRHRRIKYRPVGTTRFREYFPTVPDGDRSLEREGDAVEVRIRNATRPQPPSIHSVVPIFRWDRRVENGVYTSVRKTAGVRVYLNRPWYTTGSDELLGVVVFSSLESGGSLPNYTDERQRLARLVSQWGRDPLQGDGPAEAPLLASNFPAGVTVQREATLVELLPMSPTSYDVDVVGHAVHFDVERDLWYADVEMKIPEERLPFVRLGLTRFQPVSIPRCHLSRVVLTDFIQLMPTRTLTARTAESDGSGVYIRVTGPGLKNTTFTAEHHRRVVDPLLEPRLDITEPAPEIQVPKIELAPDAPSTPASIVMHGTLTVTRPAGQPFTLPPDLLNGRIVVTEQCEGALHLKSFSRSQTIYVETFDRDIL